MPSMASHCARNPENPNEIIRGTPWGDVPIWKYATLTCGDVGAYNEFMKSVRNDAADATARIAAADARADNLDRRESELSARETVIKDTIRKLDALFQLSGIEAQRRDEEEEQELETNLPGGELHTVPAK